MSNLTCFDICELSNSRLPSRHLPAQTIETLEKGVKYVEGGVVLVSLLLTLNIFHTLF